MKFFVVVSALLVVAKAGVITPIALPAVAYSAPVVALPVNLQSSQYHSQDAIGQYAYGYANDLSAKNEVKSADGQTVGAYSFVDGEGKIQSVQYRADAIHGFRVAASNLPVAPSVPEVAPLVQPEPVQDTPEVADARAKHLETFRQTEEQAKELAAVEVKSAIVSGSTIITSAAPAAIVKSAPTVELVRSAPIVASPAFGYSFGINNAQLFAVNSFPLQPQAFVTAYAAPGTLLSAPIVAEAVPAKVEAAQPEQASSSDTEIVEAKAKQLAEAATIQETSEKEEEKSKE